MTSPVERIRVECPRCCIEYEDWTRGSVNLALDDFDEEYLRECSTATCPKCGHVVELDTLDVEGDVWRSPVLDFNEEDVVRHACIACLRGDTPTVAAFEGKAEWIAATLVAKLQIPHRRAFALVQDAFPAQYRFECGTLPGYAIELVFRVCGECAAKAGLEVAVCYAQPSEVRVDREEER